MGKLSDKLDEFVERQQIVSAEFCKLIDQAEQLEEYNNQLVDKVKLLDAQKQNAEFKLKDVLGAYREMKEALEFYADATDVLDVDGNYDCFKIAREALKKIHER